MPKAQSAKRTKPSAKPKPRYRINRRNLLTLAVAKQGSDVPEHYKAVHVSGNGTTATDGIRLIRVSLPMVSGAPQLPVGASGAIPLAKARQIESELSGGFQAEPVTDPAIKTPGFDRALQRYSGKPDAELFCNAGMLLELLGAVLNFSADPDALIRLRVYGSAEFAEHTAKGVAHLAAVQALRIDCKPVDSPGMADNGQTFVAVQMGARVTDTCIKDFEQLTGSAPVVFHTVPGDFAGAQAGLDLPDAEPGDVSGDVYGRKYRLED